MTKEYKNLLWKLDSFIRKYYKNQIIRGILLTGIIYIFYYLFATVTEYYGQFSVAVRSVFYYTGILLFSIILLLYIIIPLLHYIRIGKIISRKQAAVIISNHFRHIEDKLLNTLELANISNGTFYSDDLINASINHKINQVKVVPFNMAINIKKNLHYLRYLLPLLLLLIFIYSFNPKILRDGHYRIVNHSTYFEPAAPFKFILVNDSLNIRKGSDLDVKIKLQGEFIPANVSISYGGNLFLMKKDNSTEFIYSLKNVNNALKVFFVADNYRSKEYNIKVLPTPTIINFELMVNPPVYTNEKATILNSVGDVTVPYGSVVRWKFATKDINSLIFNFTDSISYPARTFDEYFVFSKKFYQSSNYSLNVANEYFDVPEIVEYNIKVVPDLYPSIAIGTIKDSAQHSTFYFQGNITDDYGFTKLTFNYKGMGTDEKFNTITIPFSKNVTTQDFYYFFDFSTIMHSTDKLNSLTDDDRNIKYYFQIWDNDAIHGHKSTKSKVFEYRIPTRSELKEFADDVNKGVESKVKKASRIADELNEAVNKLQQSNIDNSASDWEKSKMIKDIVNKHDQLEQLLKDISENNKSKNDLVNSFTDEQNEILEKQKQIQELLDNMMTDELKELINEINKLQEDFNQRKFDNISKDLQLSYDDLSEQLDKNLEVLKQFEVEQGINNVIDELKTLVEKQQELSVKSGKRDCNKDEMLKQQQDNLRKFELLQDEYKEKLEKNNELFEPLNLDNFENEMQSIENEMQNGEQNIQQNKMKNASKNQQNTSEQMKDLSGKMQSMLDQNISMQTMENIDDLRQILDNLVTFSFDQEDLMGLTKKLSRRNPKFVEYTSMQKKLNDDFAIINDSLDALSGRTPEISSVVNKELLSIEKELERSIKYMTQQNSKLASVRQQLIMTSANNLALLLNEVLDAMQKQMANSNGSGGNKKCNKPNKPGDQLSEMKQQQQSLKSQLEQMLQQMKQGKGKMDKNAMNKQLSKMLAEQEIFRKMMNDLEQGTSVQDKTRKMLDEIKKIAEKTERDIINKNITQQTIDRQQQILTRLLEAENAENKRETEKKRESNQAMKKNYRSPEEIFQLNKENSIFRENLQVTDLKLMNFYRNLYKEYILNLNKE